MLLVLVSVLRHTVLDYYQVHSSTLYLIKTGIMYIDCIELYVDTIG